MITGRRQLGSTGIQNAAIAFGGRDPNASSCTETFDGSTWSASFLSVDLLLL